MGRGWLGGIFQGLDEEAEEEEEEEEGLFSRGADSSASSRVVSAF